MTMRARRARAKHCPNPFPRGGSREVIGRRPLPGERVGNDDRTRIGGGPPVDGEVDDRGRQLIREEHIPRQVTVDHLRWIIHGRQQRGEPSNMRHLQMGGHRGFAPGHPVRSCPRVVVANVEGGTGDTRQARVQAIRDPDDVQPTPTLMAPFAERRGHPAVDHECSQRRSSRHRDPELATACLTERLGLPGDGFLGRVGWFDHDAACARRALVPP